MQSGWVSFVLNAKYFGRCPVKQQEFSSEDMAFPTWQKVPERNVRKCPRCTVSLVYGHAPYPARKNGVFKQFVSASDGLGIGKKPTFLSDNVG